MRSGIYRRAAVSPLLAALPPLCLAAGIVTIGGAFYFERIAGLRPCELCLAERWPWYALIVIASIVAFIRSPVLKTQAALLMGLVLLGSAGLAAYHVAVEQHWVGGPSACSGQSLLGRSAADAVKALMAAPVIRCDEVQWNLFGVSLAGWNMLASLILACFAIAAWKSQRSFGARRNGFR